MAAFLDSSDGERGPLDTCNIDEQRSLSLSATTNPESVCSKGLASSSNGASPNQKDTPPTHPLPNKDCIDQVDSIIRELSLNHSILEEELKTSISNIKELLDQKERDMLASYKATFDEKLNILNRHREDLMSSSTPEKKNPRLPSLFGGTLCGFVPEMTNLIHSTASLVLEHRRDVVEGNEMEVSVIGSMNKEGCFHVRILPDPVGLQDIMLQNMSNSISLEISLSPFSPLKLASVGDLCCALYAEDQRWYRVRVMEPPKGKKVKVYFVDYGNVEMISCKDISKLHQKFLVYPFQMIQCCLTDDPNLTYEREVRWNFTDMTHGSDLRVKILRHLPHNSHGKLHLVQLTNCSGVESYDVGAVMSGCSSVQGDPRQHGKVSNHNHQAAIFNTPALSSSTKPLPKSTPTVTVTQEVTSLEHEKMEVNSELSELPFQSSSSSSFISSSPTPTTSDNIASSLSQISAASSSKESHTPSAGEPGQSAESVQEVPSVLVEEEVRSSPDVGERVVPLVVNDVINSAAQIKVAQPTAKNAPTRSASLSPIPVPMTGNQTASKETVSKETTGSTQSEGVDSLYPQLKQGEGLEVYVTTPLATDGSFWAQLTTAEEPEFLEMVENLQRHYFSDPPTPAFFSPGDICASQFSEDYCWYRSRVEGIDEDKFLVRYLDFGNSERRGKEFLNTLKSDFQVIRFQALQCSIACPDYTSFSQKEIDRFEELTHSKKLTAKILKVQDKMVYVKLLLVLPEMTLDLNEEVYTADVIKLGESLSFSLKKPSSVHHLKSSSEYPTSVISMDGVKKTLAPTNWADYMDDLDSPQNDGIFTLPGQEDTTRTPSPMPTPTSHRSSPSPNPYQNNRFTPPPPSHTPWFQRSASPNDGTQKSAPSKKNNSHRSRTPNLSAPQQSSNRSSSMVPRIQSNALGMVRKNLLIAEKKNERAKSVQSSITSDQGILKSNVNVTSDLRGGYFSSSSSSLSTSPSAPPGLPQPKGIRSINQISRNGTSFPPTGRRKKSPEPDSTQIIDKEGGLRAVEGLNGNHLSGSPKPLSVQIYKTPCGLSRDQADFDNLPNTTRLFVKNIPTERTMEDLKSIFAKFGEVKGLVPVQSRRHVVFIYMDPDGALDAIDNLHGKAIAKLSRPLIVQISHPQRN